MKKLLLWTALLGARAMGEGWMQPFPVGSVASFRPNVGAYLPSQLAAGSLRFQVDGRNFTNDVVNRQGCFWWAPPYDLDRGRHQATLSVGLSNGQTLSRTWSFNIADGSAAGAPHFEVVQTGPGPCATLSNPVRTARLWVDGREAPTSLQGVTVRATPAGLGGGNHRAQLLAQGLDGSVVEKSWTFSGGSRPPSNPQTPPLGVVAARQPIPGQCTDGKPLIRVQFREAVSDVRLVVDGNDLTSVSQVSPSEILWRPNYSINYGPHRVELTARRNRGGTLQDSWYFCAVRYTGAQLDQLNRIQPPDGSLRETPELGVSPQGETSARPNVEISLPPGKTVLRQQTILDGGDFTGRMQSTGSSLRWTPDYNLDLGGHSGSVIIEATDHTFYSRNWTFQVR